MITIANPIYDIVFKKLMEDLAAAQSLLSALLGEEVEILELLPQERTLSMPGTQGVTVMRFDYRATLRYKDKIKKVLIELQKSKNVEDIGRFRRYLGENYQVPDVREGVESYLPIIAIYLLGFTLNYQPAILRVNPVTTDLSSTPSVVEVLDDVMVEGLTHTSYFVQIPRLPKRYGNRVERVLAVFAQNWVLREDKHLMQVPDELRDDPLIRPLLNRLERIIADPEVIRQAAEEEGFEKHYVRSLAKSKAEGKAEGALEKAKETARNLKKIGLSLEQIAKATGLSELEINGLS